ncbi:CrcB family protein, partial [Salmonella enterica]
MGAALGAWLRWRISVVWNVDGHFVPLGTLAANWIGAGVIGFLVAYFE